MGPGSQPHGKRDGDPLLTGRWLVQGRARCWVHKSPAGRALSSLLSSFVLTAHTHTHSLCCFSFQQLFRRLAM